MGKGCSGHSHTQSQLDHYANQHNPNNAAYQARGDNHANQCNPNNSLYEGSSNAGQCRIVAIGTNDTSEFPKSYSVRKIQEAVYVITPKKQ